MLHQAHGVDLMDICAGGHLDQGTMGWLGERTDALRNTVSATASAFFDQARSMYQMISSNDAIQALRNLTVKNDNAWDTNTIHAISTIAGLQTAAPVMQRWIMAEPRLRQMYVNNEVDGFSETYTNLQGDNIGAKQFDWRQVNTGIVKFKEDEAYFTNYHEELYGNDELSVSQRVDILRTWNAVNDALDAGEEDPSSPYGLQLG
jgi:hypothetical protein